MYRGREGMWAWIFHRLTGLAVFLFLLTHILDTALIGAGPKVYNQVIQLYRHPFFLIGEIFLVAAVLYHTLNGLRVILIDFWEKGTLYQRQLFWAEMALFLVIFIPVAIVMLSHLH